MLINVKFSMEVLGMKTISLLTFFCFCFSTQSFANDVTINGDSAISKLVRKAVLGYYHGATWNNKGVDYQAFNGGQFIIIDSIGVGTPASCPSGDFSITKTIVGQREQTSFSLGIPTGRMETTYEDVLFTCVSVEDFLNYVANGIYPVSNK